MMIDCIANAVNDFDFQFASLAFVFVVLLSAPDGHDHVDVLYTAIAYYSMNNQANAASLLIGRMEKCPYDTAFMNGAIQLADAYGFDPTQAWHFNAADDNVRTDRTKPGLLKMRSRKRCKLQKALKKGEYNSANTASICGWQSIINQNY